MKKEIHPQYFQSSVTCACGNTFVTGSTLKTINVEICSNCHPFYTGKQKLVDTARRVEKFQAKQAKTKAAQETISARKKTQKIAADKKPSA